MTETKRLEKIELKEITDLRDGYAQTTTQFGQLRVEKLMVNQQMETLDRVELDLENRYIDLQKKESEVVKKLNEKYGVGQLNLESGEFTPVEASK